VIEGSKHREQSPEIEGEQRRNELVERVEWGTDWTPEHEVEQIRLDRDEKEHRQVEAKRQRRLQAKAGCDRGVAHPNGRQDHEAESERDHVANDRSDVGYRPSNQGESANRESEAEDEVGKGLDAGPGANRGQPALEAGGQLSRFR
jgi:hypothetical protein